MFHLKVSHLQANCIKYALEYYSTVIVFNMPISLLFVLSALLQRKILTSKFNF